MFALLTAEPSRAHVDVRPELVEQGEVTELTLELPLITPGPEMTRIELEGEGVEVLSTRRLPNLPGPEAQWTARVRVDAPIGQARYVLRPSYADGGSVEFRRAFTVVPAEDASFPWAYVLVGAAVVLLTAGGGLVLLRRRA